MQDTRTPSEMIERASRVSLRARLGPVAVVLGVLLASGAAQRAIEAQIDAAVNRSIPTLQPLSTIPLRLGSWSGQDVPLDEQVRRIAGEDDFVNRAYVHESSRRAVGVYVGYLGRPRSRLGHRVAVCRTAHGWKMVSEERWTMTSHEKGGVPSLIYEWNRPGHGNSREMDLTFHVINGQWRNDPDELDQYNRRDVFGRSARYVARIQLTVESSGDRKADLETLSDLASEILGPVRSLLPDHVQTASAARP